MDPEIAMDAIIGQFGESSSGLPDSLSPDDGVSLLQKYEDEVFLGARQAQDGINRMVYSIHTIRQHHLWLYAVNDSGQQCWLRWEDYLRDLADRVRVGRSTVFGYLASMRIADALGFDIDDVERMGGIRTFNAVRSMVNYDRETGEVTGLRDPGMTIPTDVSPADYVRSAIISIMPAGERSELTPADVHRALSDQLSQTPTIRFFLSQNSRGGYELEWQLETTTGSSRGTLSEHQPPAAVLDKIIAGLHICL